MTTRSVISIDPTETLFESNTSLKDRFPILTWATLGILHVQELFMETNRIYLLDSQEHNEYFVYDRDSVGRARKTFWKVKDYKIEKIESALKKFDITAEINGIPCFDPAFGNNAGSWVKLNYVIRVQVSIFPEKIGYLKESTAPLRTVHNRLLEAARSTLPFLSYQEALTAQTKEKLADWLRGYAEVNATGLSIEMVEIEAVEGSKKVEDGFQGQFNRLLEAKDKSDIAMMFKQLDDESINAYLTLGGLPDAGNIITARNRITQQMLTAMLADGKSVMQAYKQSLEGIDRPKSSMAVEPDKKPLQNSVAEHLFDQTKDIDWDKLQIPETKKHIERLEWERDVFMERVPQWLTDGADEKLFTLKVGEGNDILQIRWDDKDAPPQVWLNGKSRQDDYAILSPSAWDPEKRTLWDVYLATWRLV